MSMNLTPLPKWKKDLKCCITCRFFVVRLDRAPKCISERRADFSDIDVGSLHWPLFCCDTHNTCGEFYEPAI